MIFDISQIGVFVSPVNFIFKPIMIFYLLVNLLIFIIAGLLFAFESLKSEKAETKLKGKFLVIAFVLYLLGATIEAIETFPPSRLILVVSGIFFYIGFLLPDWIKKRFLK